MPNIIKITDLYDPALDPYFRLTEAQLRNKRNPSEGIFIAESHKVIGHALDAGCEPVSFLMERRQIEGVSGDLLRRCPDTPVYTADRETLAQLTGYELTRGCLSAMRRPEPKPLAEILSGAHRVAVLDGIADAANVGAILRSAAALHMDAILLSPPAATPSTGAPSGSAWAPSSRSPGRDSAKTGPISFAPWVSSQQPWP